MEHSTEDFAKLSQQHVAAANQAASRAAHEMNLELAHHYARIAALKGNRQGQCDRI